VDDRYTPAVMPTYEYACRSCGHTFEVVQSMSDDPLTTCPRCEGELRKVFAPPAIAFKGSGFYATDHGKKARDAEKPPDKAADKAAGKGTTSGGSKTSDGASGAKEGSSTSSTSSAKGTDPS
jgi:putative FmdB family regulatory protein